MILTMKCPKCNCDIDDKMLVCPNCKKVLKLVCPKCNTINKTNTCKKCGFVIITKCHKCGKINQTINSTCTKCGFSTYTSIAIGSSNIEEFACLTIEFPNLNDIKSALGSTKLVDKFKANLDQLILNQTASIGLKREIIQNIYIIRFNKDASFYTSANNAIKAAIEIQNSITELNFKLNKLASASLKCNIAVLKRDIYSQPENYKSGFDIKLIYQNKKDLKLLNNLQIITDSYIYEQTCDNYDLSSLTAKFIKNEMMMFFELNLKKYIKIPKAKEEDDTTNLEKLNIFDDNLPETENDDIYDVDAINFDELKCSFTKTKSINLLTEISKLLKKNPKKIISIKSEKELFPHTTQILSELENLNLYKNVFRVTCYDEMKYKPYGFFHELISSIYNFSQSPKNIGQNNLSMFKGLDPSEFVKDLINLTPRTFPHPEDVRFSLFDIFLTVFQSMPKSIIYIENFEKIDDTSYEVMQLLFEKFNELDVSYVILSTKDFSLHKKSHFLLSNPDYAEITLRPTPFKEIIAKNIQQCKLILESYYMQKIAHNCNGSVLYFDNAIQYLLEKELLLCENEVYTAAEFENILIPTTLEDLIAKRLKNLSKYKTKDKIGNDGAYKMFSMLLLIGPRIDFLTIKLLQFPDELKILKFLADKGYIYIHGNTVYIQNYNLYREVFSSDISLESKQPFIQIFADELLQKAFTSEIKHPMETVLYKMIDREKQEFIVWEKLSQLNASMGDFSAYLNCSTKFLKLLDNHINESSQKTIEEYKMEVYENISNLLYKYSPNEIHNIAQIILNNLERTKDDKKVLELCNKMLQGCLIGGNYSYALDLVHKILSKFPNASIDPDKTNFHKSFFLVSLIKIEVLFSIGNLKDCIDLGYEILDILNKENLAKLKPEHLSDKQFEEVIFDSMSFVAISGVILLRDELKDFTTKLQEKMGILPVVFSMFLSLQKIIKGNKIKIPANVKLKNDKFSQITLNIIKAFNDNRKDYKKFAENIYQAKISAKQHNLSQIELICDLLIGYSYFKLNNSSKASSIYYNVLDTSTKNGLKTVTNLAWYLISMLKFKNREIDVAFGITNNSTIQLEKDYNSSDFLLFLFRILLSEILMAKNEKQTAQLCLNNAKFIKEKYGLSFSLGEEK